MSLIIKGMQLPDGCNECDLLQIFDEDETFICPLSPYYRWCGTPPDYRPEGCRLKRIPTPHGRLIDADKLIKFIQDGINREHDSFGYDGIEILAEVQFSQTIIEAEVSK